MERGHFRPQRRRQRAVHRAALLQAENVRPHGAFQEILLALHDVGLLTQLRDRRVRPGEQVVAPASTPNSVPKSTTVAPGEMTLNPTALCGTRALSLPRFSFTMSVPLKSNLAGDSIKTTTPFAYLSSIIRISIRRSPCYRLTYPGILDVIFLIENRATGLVNLGHNPGTGWLGWKRSIAKPRKTVSNRPAARATGLIQLRMSIHQSCKKRYSGLAGSLWARQCDPPLHMFQLGGQHGQSNDKFRASVELLISMSSSAISSS